MKSFISSILLLVLFATTSLAQDTLTNKLDSLAVSKQSKPKEKHFQYVRIGIDVSRLIRSALTDEYTTAEFLVESIWKPKMHYIAEGGFANVHTDEDNISFTSTTYFLRFGFDKYFFGKLFKEDLDNAFIGLRLAGAYHSREEAKAMLWDPFYGSSTISKPGENHLLYWIELTTGFRMELSKNIFVGWNIRGKTFINPTKIKELTPSYLAGYGRAKKQPAFDYNFYLLYGFGKR